MSKNNSSTAATATASASTTSSSSLLVGNGNRNHESRGAASPDVRPATNTMTAAPSATAQVVSPLQTNDSSVVIDSSSSSSAGSAAVAPSSAAAPVTTTTTTTTTAAAQKEREENSQQEPNQQLDFIVSSHAVKSLFALPYTAADQTISVAIHNLDGTLLIDEDPELAAAEQQPSPPFYPQRATAATTGSFRRRNNSRRRPRPTPPQLPRHEENETCAAGDVTNDHDGGSTINASTKQGEMTTTLALLPDSEKHTTSSNETAMITLVVDSLKNQSLLTQHAAQALLPVLAIAAAAPSPAMTTGGDSSSGRTTTGGGPLGLPQPHEYVEPYMPSPAVEPREYLSWNFQDLNLLVGSNALVFRAPSAAASAASQQQQPQSDAAAVNHGEEPNVQNTGQAMLAVRFADVHEMQALMERHVDVLRIQQQQQQQRLLFASSPGAANKPISYAEAVLKQRQQQQSSRNTTKDKAQDDKDEKHDGDGDLDRVRLQTCIVAVPHAPLGSLVEASFMQKHQQKQEQQPGGTGTRSDDAQQRHHPMDDRASVLLSSPAVTTVLDAYLDNIMSNVPQLALCLREKGFIQSVKLLETQDIPSRLLHPLTLDTSKPFEMVSSSSTSSSSSARNTNNNGPRNSPSTSSLAGEMADDEVFSPQIIEMNAATLLRFLQTSCTRNNSTYLLQREKGQSKIQLYDISSISQQKQRKWIWWLAMMSYRFANRLGHIAHVQGNDENHSGGCSPALLRSFRNRQRSLLQNTLDLLECLSDMDGMSHESLVAAVREQLADTFLWKDADSSHEAGSAVAADYSSTTTTTASSSRPLPPPIAPATAACSLQQPYGGVTVDALNKAHDHLGAGIKYLWPILERNVLKRAQQSAALKKKKEKKNKRNHNHSKQQQQQASASPSDSLLTVSEDTSSSSDEEKNDSTDDDADADEYDFEIEAVATQLFGLHQKLLNVSLRLAEIHLKNYTSSNAMQSLRTTARRIADSLYLVGLLSSSQAEQETGYSNQHDHQHRPEQSNMAEWICRLQLQFVWLWEHCGHFARSFAGDQLWRERGHAAADDILIVLQDAEAAIRDHQQLNSLSSKSCRRHADSPPFDSIFHLDPLFEKTSGSVTLHSLSGLVKKQRDDGTTTNDSPPSSTGSTDDADDTAMEAALKILDKQRFLQREERKVIIAACIAYARAICAYEALRSSHDGISPANILFDPALLGLLQQRQGDACNEAGKILLNQLRSLLTSLPADQSGDKAVSLAAESLLSSSEFWFSEGLSAFEKCHDLRNIALLRCNLCQCYKLRANAIFAPTTQKSRGTADGPTHAEHCLQEAANQLQAAHESLDQREADPVCWDMVSTELAAAFLVLGVRRRQSLIGSGNVPVFVQALRLSPGKERSIVDPMERALTIYEEAGNFQQAAAAHYQLAQFFAKIWCCQRDESKTRQKLSAAFSHYNAALSFFSNAIRGNETTFCLLCLDLSSLYSSVQGEEGLSKSLLVCLDTHKAFSAETIKAKTQTPGRYDDWFQQMETLASNVEDRVFSALRSLVKLQEDGSDASPKRPYKDVYRAGLQAKVVAAASSSLPSVLELTTSYPAAARLIAVHDILLALQSAMNSSRAS